MTGMLSSAETVSVTNDPLHVESIKDSSQASMDNENLLYNVEMEPDKGVLFLTQNLLVEMSGLQVLSDFISNEMELDYSVFCWPKLYLAAILTFVLLSDIAQHGAELIFSNGLKLRRLPNRRLDTHRNCVVHGVPNLRRPWKPLHTTLKVT